MRKDSVKKGIPFLNKIFQKKEINECEYFFIKRWEHYDYKLTFTDDY